MTNSPGWESIPESDAYEIIQLLGHGVFGLWYRGRARATGNEVALKMSVNLDQESLLFFLHEFEIVRELDHPNIIHAVDLFRMKDRIFIAFEYFHGIDCFRVLEPPLISNRERLPRLVFVLMQVFEALKYLHDHQIVHGNFRPSKILLDKNLHVKIVGFGLARRLDRDESHLSAYVELVGAQRYLTPEAVLGNTTETASDAFVLGLIVFEWLYGQNPIGPSGQFSEIIERLIRQRMDVEFLCKLGASKSVAAVLARMLEFDASRRRGKYVEFFADLRVALEMDYPVPDRNAN